VIPPRLARAGSSGLGLVLGGVEVRGQEEVGEVRDADRVELSAVGWVPGVGCESLGHAEAHELEVPLSACGVPVWVGVAIHACNVDADSCHGPYTVYPGGGIRHFYAWRCFWQLCRTEPGRGRGVAGETDKVGEPDGPVVASRAEHEECMSTLFEEDNDHTGRGQPWRVEHPGPGNVR
jgi:hypothetical protein